MQVRQEQLSFVSNLGDFDCDDGRPCDLFADVWGGLHPLWNGGRRLQPQRRW